MRTRATFLLVVLSVSGALQASSVNELLEQSAPDFALKSTAGQNLRLSEYRGEIVLFNLWATWCGPCREQMTALDKLHEQFASDGVKVLSVSVDPRSKKARRELATLRHPFPVLVDEDKFVSRLYDPSDLPLALLIDQTGTVRAVHEGFKPDDIDHYRSEITALLAE